MSYAAQLKLCAFEAVRLLRNFQRHRGLSLPNECFFEVALVSEPEHPYRIIALSSTLVLRVRHFLP